jgi:hypothetical protein
MAPPQQLDPSFFSQQPYVRERRPQKPRGKSPLGERVRFVGLLRARAAAGVAGAGSTRNHQKKTSTAVMACCVMQGTASLSFAPVSQSVVFALDNQRQMLSMLSNGLAASWKGQQVSSGEYVLIRRDGRALFSQPPPCCTPVAGSAGSL